MMRGYIDTSDGQLHYRREGRGGPTIVLFHESPLSSEIFSRALPVLGRSVQAWAFDTPGYGLSDPPPAALNLPDYASRLLTGIRSLGIDCFTVGGVHTGAGIALEVARQAGPEVVPQMVLSGLPLLSLEEQDAYLASWLPRVDLTPDGDYLHWAWDRYRQHWGTDTPLELIHLAVSHLVSNYDRYDWAYGAAFRYDAASALIDISCDVLLLNGERDSLIRTDERVKELLASVKQVTVPNMRGQLPWRVPDLYAQEITSFIRNP